MNKGEKKRDSVLRNFFVGFFVGIGAVAPGISGGAIAVIFGLYEKITTAIATFYKDFWKKIKFLLPLAIGAVVGIILFADVIVFLFEHYESLMKSLFVGLMFGTLPSLTRTAKKKGFSWWYMLLAFVAAVVTVFLTMAENLQYSGDIHSMPVHMLLICGAILGVGTIVPGISSSFILMSMGLYESVMLVINKMDIAGIIPIGIGFVLSFLLLSNIVSWLYKKAYGAMSFTVLGLLCGSIVAVFPPISMNFKFMTSIAIMVIGAVLTYMLVNYADKRQGKLEMADKLN